MLQVCLFLQFALAFVVSNPLVVAIVGQHPVVVVFVGDSLDSVTSSSLLFDLAGGHTNIFLLTHVLDISR